jgi:hypothetical protein
MSLPFIIIITIIISPRLIHFWLLVLGLKSPPATLVFTYYKPTLRPISQLLNLAQYVQLYIANVIFFMCPIFRGNKYTFFYYFIIKKCKRQKRG